MSNIERDYFTRENKINGVKYTFFFLISPYIIMYLQLIFYSVEEHIISIYDLMDKKLWSVLF